MRVCVCVCLGCFERRIVNRNFTICIRWNVVTARKDVFLPPTHHGKTAKSNWNGTPYLWVRAAKMMQQFVCLFVCVFFSGAKEKPCVQDGEVLLKQDGAATSVTVDRWSEVAKPSCHGFFLFLHACLCLLEYKTSKRFTCKNGKRDAIFLLYLTLGIEAYLRFFTISHFDELVDVVLECAML